MAMLITECLILKLDKKNKICYNILYSGGKI
jgi:hypothetical protein